MSPRLLLTNHHVLPNAAHAKRSLVEFNYQESASGEMQSSEVVTLLPNTLYLSDSNLDYALVAVAPKPARVSQCKDQQASAPGRSPCR